MIGEIRAVSDRLWIVIPENVPGVDQPNIGVLAAGDRAVLIDCGNSPAYLRAILRKLESTLPGPISTIIYTHHHWDHVFGAAALSVPVIAHERCYQHLRPWAEKKINRSFWEKEIQSHPLFKQSHRAKISVIDSWDDFRIVLPTITFQKEMALHLGSSTLELLHLEAPHSDDSTLVHLVEEKVLFLGDALYPPPVYARTHRPVSLRKMSAALPAEEIDLFVPGHGEPMDRDAFRTQLKRNIRL